MPDILISTPPGHQLIFGHPEQISVRHPKP
ncbi:hypothetical protein FHS35_008505 [Streptomyces umbrinus]|nr:hypothetical protein [Streptomyces umbrinus]